MARGDLSELSSEPDSFSAAGGGEFLSTCLFFHLRKCDIISTLSRGNCGRPPGHGPKNHHKIWWFYGRGTFQQRHSSTGWPWTPPPHVATSYSRETLAYPRPRRLDAPHPRKSPTPDDALPPSPWECFPSLELVKQTSTSHSQTVERILPNVG